MKLLITLFSMVAMAIAEDVTKTEETLNKGNDQFTAKIFTEVKKNNPGKSVVFSGFSVLTPLSQLVLASEGESHDELLKATGFPSDNATKEIFSVVKSKLSSVNGVDLRIANRVYVADGFKLNDDFATTSRDVFNSDVKNVDFIKKTETAGEINAWVESQTNNRIKDLVDPASLNVDTRAILVNALYFKGKWEKPFSKKATTDRDFHVSKDNTVKLPTMHRKGIYRYGESNELNAKLLELHYEGRESSFIIVLPNEVDGLAALEEKLKDPAALNKATENFEHFLVDVYLPKFKIETTTDLKTVLQKIGVEKIFVQGAAKLNKLLKDTAENLYVSEAIQKAFIEVNEEGAEAAVANEVEVQSRSSRVFPQSEFVADHPFFFILKLKDIQIFEGEYVV